MNVHDVGLQYTYAIYIYIYIYNLPNTVLGFNMADLGIPNSYFCSKYDVCPHES